MSFDVTNFTDVADITNVAGIAMSASCSRPKDDP